MQITCRFSSGMDLTLFPREDLYKNLYNTEFARFILEPVLDCIEEEVEEDPDEFEETASVLKNSKKKKKKKKKRNKAGESGDLPEQVSTAVCHTCAID